MKTFFESYCPTETVPTEQLKTFIDNKIKANDYYGLSTKLKTNDHDLGSYETVDLYINAVEPDWDDTESDEAYEYDMLIDQAKKLSEAINQYLYDTD